MGSSADWKTLARPFRVFVDDAEALVGEADGVPELRAALTSAQPFSALTFLMTKPASYRAAYLPEILAAVARGPSQSLLLARDVLRCLPRVDLEDQVPVLLGGILQMGDDDQFGRMAEVIVELRLTSALVVLRGAAAGHPDEEIRELHKKLDGVEDDGDRWGRLVSEWPIRKAR